MKALVWLTFLSNFMGFSINHDVPIAIFKLYEKEGNIHLSIVMDAEDLAKSTSVTATTISDEIILNYLNENTAWLFDDRMASIDWVSINLKGEHFKIEAKLSVPIRDFSKIDINNTCLNSISNHSNIIQIELGEEIKDFRMHKHRTLIKVEL